MPGGDICRCRKIGYTSALEARRELSRARGHGGNDVMTGRMSVYRCPDNDSLWHLGHTFSKRQRRRRERGLSSSA